MTRVGIKVGVALLILAALAYVTWDRKYSRGARIDAAYRTCMSDLGAAAADARGDASGPNTTTTGNVTARGMADAMTSLRDRFGAAVCGAVRDACTTNFDGTICQAALRRAR